jgi:LDH2 family malate/lactate/ureidoglycolate dehydrogenase
MVLFFALFGFLFLSTQYLQFVLGYSPSAAGARILPYAGAMIVFAPLSSQLVARFGSKRVVTHHGVAVHDRALRSALGRGARGLRARDVARVARGRSRGRARCLHRLAPPAGYAARTLGKRLVTAAELGGLVRACFERAGLTSEDAGAVAEVLVDANLRGTDSHGIGRVPVYLRRVHDGLAGGADAMASTVDAGALARLDAKHGLGPAVGVRAVDLAAELAARHGIGAVAVGRSTHFGAAGFYARRAAHRGLVALVASNGPANMAPYGAAEPFLGTNAIAVAGPLGTGGEVFSLDMSSSVEARGKIIRADALGQPIAPGLAIDAAGRPTTDAAAALAGAVLPLGGPKGSGLAFAVCVLAAVLGGADFDDELAPMTARGGGAPRPQNVGHIFLALEPGRLAYPGEAGARVDALVERLHALKPAEGFVDVLYPGERGDRLAAERRAGGIPVEEAELEAIAVAATDCDMPGLADHARGLGTPVAG